MVAENTEAVQRHNRVCHFAEESIREMHSSWAKTQALEPFLVTWPEGAVRSIEGKPVTGPCLLRLSGVDPATWSEKIAQAVSLTGAYAVLLAEQKSDAVIITLETSHGARCWTLPIVRKGDVYRLGKSKVSSDLEHLGVLWSPKKNQA